MSLQQMMEKIEEKAAEVEALKAKLAEVEKKCDALEFQLRQALLALDQQEALRHMDEHRTIIDVSKLALTRKESMIVKTLASGQFVSRQSVLISVWGEADRFNSRSLDVFMTKLRKILAPEGYEIETHHGQGFKLIKKISDGQVHS